MAFSVLVEEKDSVQIITLRDESNSTEAEIYSFGALLNSFSVTQKNKRINIIDGFSSPADAKENITKGFKSAKLSPFVCRMNKGEYTFNEQSHKIQKFYLGDEAIHGLIYNAPFDIKKYQANNEKAFVHLSYGYNNKNEGFPFSYTTEVIYTLTANNNLSIQTIVTNTSNSEMPLNDGWHPYFKLGETVNDLHVQFNSNSMLEFDSRLLPSGKIIPYEKFETMNAFENTKLDNCFVLKDHTSPSCILKDNNSGIEFTITADSSYPYLQVYTPPHRKSIAVENLSSAPDSFNNHIGLIIAKPNEQFTFTTSYQISTL
jgi:aldose 1-epimerase